MTIAKRLMILVAGALIGCLFIGGVAIIQTASVNNSSLRISEDTIPSIVTINKISREFDSIRGLTYRHIIQADPSKNPIIEEKIASTREELNGAVKAYSRFVHDARDNSLFLVTKAQIGDYLAEMDKALDYSRNNKILEAGASAEKLATLGDKAVAAIKSNVDYNLQLAAANRASMSSAATRAWWIIGAAIALMVLVLTLSGMLIYRQICGSLHNAQKAIKAIESSLDFTIRTEAKEHDEISQTLAVFNLLIERLQSNLLALKEGVKEVSLTSASLLGASQQVAQSSSQQSASSSHISVSVEQMTASISHVATRANEASELSSRAGRNAQNGQKIIDVTVGNIHSIATAVEAAASDIQELGAKSKDITTIVNVISDVAEQTNLLALNAAIEAARAGESGRGFAVVADEVRKLAERTAASTQEISHIIQSILRASESAADRMENAVNQVEQGVKGASSAQQSMALIYDSSSQSQKVATEISDVLGEQRLAASNIALQVEKFAGMTNENSSAAGQAASIAEKLEKVSGKMRGIVDAYRL
ncbi:methyl-accepting chemotaxis protein [Pseudogulbenkiania sp. MAI-1]|uniref:methyl-accepting chemotaxis protein n=1 Tax=Pseudogulbenkiania sp. MAI-1 TaxID=990370 RepID=UPI00045E78B7|nr:methyl-accepting chemotaxis protein [Pseudogulbenkiania sp. MAI-1]